MPPVRRAGRHHVEVTVHEQGRPVPVPAGDARDHAGALGVRLQDGRLEVDLRQESGDMFGGLALAGTGVISRVGRVDPDQVAADVHDLGLCGHLVRCHPSIVAPGRCVRPVVPAWPRISLSRDSPEAAGFAKVSQPMRTPHRASGWRNRQTR